MQELFASLSQAVSGAPALALGASFIWGILSVLLSPCHLASIPLIVAFIGTREHQTARRAGLLSSAFATGILITIALIGVATAAAGRLMGDLGPWVNYVVAGVFLLVGLSLWDALPMPWGSAQGAQQMRRRGVLAAFIMGLVYGVALGPCTFAYMAPMLAVVFALSATDMWYGVLLLVVYAIGHCGVIVLAGTASGWVHRYLAWSEQSRGTLYVKRICGLLIVIAGLHLIYTGA